MDIRLQRFAKQMDNELKSNAITGKGDIFEWKEDVKYKLFELEYHKSKLIFAIKEKNRFAIKEYIADIGNILMSIGNDFNLYNSDSEMTGLASVMVDELFEIKHLDEVKIKKF